MPECLRHLPRGDASCFRHGSSALNILAPSATARARHTGTRGSVPSSWTRHAARRRSALCRRRPLACHGGTMCANRSLGLPHPTPDQVFVPFGLGLAPRGAAGNRRPPPWPGSARSRATAPSQVPRRPVRPPYGFSADPTNTAVVHRVRRNAAQGRSRSGAVDDPGLPNCGRRAFLGRRPRIQRHGPGFGVRDDSAVSAAEPLRTGAHDLREPAVGGGPDSGETSCRRPSASREGGISVAEPNCRCNHANTRSWVSGEKRW